jgi:hypothetical protein
MSRKNTGFWRPADFFFDRNLFRYYFSRQYRIRSFFQTKDEIKL